MLQFHPHTAHDAQDAKPSLAIERWAHYRENTHRYFRLTPKNTVLGLFWCVFIPYITYQGVLAQQVRSLDTTEAVRTVCSSVSMCCILCCCLTVPPTCRFFALVS